MIGCWDLAFCVRFWEFVDVLVVVVVVAAYRF